MDSLAPQKTFLLNEVTPSAALKGRVYLAGPMTGIPEYNFPAFNAKAKELRAKGYQVVNPAEHGVHDWATWEDYLRYDLAQVATCGAIYFLSGWESSRGACFEAVIARTLKLEMLADPQAVSPDSLAEGLEGLVARQAAILAALPADWSKDSSLATWFPLTAQQLERQEQEIRELRMQAAQVAQLREALRVARDHVDMSALEMSHSKDAALIDAALQGSSRGEVAVTWNQEGTEILMVSRQDEDGKILSIIASTAQPLRDHCAKNGFEFPDLSALKETPAAPATQNQSVPASLWRRLLKIGLPYLERHRSSWIYPRP